MQTNGVNHPCNNYYASAGECRFVLPEGAPVQLGEAVALVCDDGFVLAALRTADFTRWYASGDVLVLTNLPEPGPMPEPPPPKPTALEQLRADMDFIAIMTGVAL